MKQTNEKDREILAEFFKNSLNQKQEKKERTALLNELWDYLTPAQRLYCSKEQLLEIKNRLLTQFENSKAKLEDLSERLKIQKSKRDFGGTLKGAVSQTKTSSKYTFENDIKLHEELKQLSIYVYHTDTQKIPNNWEEVGYVPNKNTGFDGYVFKKNNDVVIVYRGSEERQDFLEDMKMFSIKHTDQLNNAQKLYDIVSNKYKDARIMTAGHSLGGSLSGCIGAINNIHSVTFNAFSAGLVLEKWFKKNNPNGEIHSDKVINYRYPGDKLTDWNKKNEIGTTYQVNVSAKIANGENDYFYNHKVENMQDLSTRVLYNTKTKFNNQKDDTTEYDSNTSECVGSYEVSGYTRADGKEVSSYVRSCGASHDK